MKNTEQLIENHKEQLDNLVDEIYLIVSGIMEDLLRDGDLKEEEYDWVEKELNVKSIDYVIKRLQTTQKDW